MPDKSSAEIVMFINSHGFHDINCRCSLGCIFEDDPEDVVRLVQPDLDFPDYPLGLLQIRHKSVSSILSYLSPSRLDLELSVGLLRRA